MEILKCPECGNEITASMESCPNCGCPVSMMSSITNDNRSKWQKRMVSLAMPIAIMAIISALFWVFSFFKLSESMETLSKIRFGGRLLLVFILFSLMMVWFLSLYGGSAKKTNLRTISVVAIIGIILFLLYDLIRIRIFLGCNLMKNQYPGWWNPFIINMVFSLKYVLFGAAFCAIGKYFQGKMNTRAVLLGISFLFCGILSVVLLLIIMKNSGIIWISINIFCYLLLALFFLGFSKTSKSKYHGKQ